jgi:hypothetical protein
MSTLYTPYRSGSLFGTLYTFENVGDGLPSHSHTSEMEHNVIVMAGAIKLVTPNLTTYHGVGNVIDFDGSKPHHIVALEPYTKTLNLYLHGIPAEYKPLPESAFIGRLEAQHL